MIERRLGWIFWLALVETFEPFNEGIVIYILHRNNQRTVIFSRLLFCFDE